jgi:amino acid adenylation domain-containing protein
VVTLHHIASDGWSNSLLVKEVTALYNQFSGGIQADLPELPIQYADYSIWQRHYLQGELLDKKLAYWKNKLNNVSGFELPIDKVRPALQSTKGTSISFKIDQALTNQLESLSNTLGASMFMTLLSAFKILLYRYSNQTDITIGTPIAGRQHQETEDLIGFFINTLVLRTELDPQNGFTDVLEHVKSTTLEAFDNQEVPFERIVDAVVSERDLSRNPLFQIMFIYQNTPDVPELTLGDLTVKSKSTETTTVKFDLTFSLSMSKSGLVGSVHYSTDLYEKATIQRMINHFEQVLQSAAQMQTHAISDINLITPQEKLELNSFNQTFADFPQNQTILNYFEKQVEITPNNIAVEFENESITYLELNNRVNKLANFLIEQGIKHEMLVPLCIERSIEMLVGILGIMKSGAAYVPVDPDNPTDRIAYILKDIQAKFVITLDRFKSLFSEQQNLVFLDSSYENVLSQNINNPTIKVKPENLAYVIYTSGSTGKPKGVMNQHNGLINRLQWGQVTYQLKAGEKILQKTPFSFDISLYELLWPMMTGATLVFAKPQGHKDPEYLMNIVENSKINLIHFVPSMLDIFLERVEKDKCLSLRQVFASGEALGRMTAEEFKKKIPHAFLDNLYGPTEAAIEVSYWRIPSEKLLREVPIGSPVANTKLYIVNSAQQLCPVGIPGELYIEGVQVARGYLNQPELSAEKFIDSPFTPGQRVYKTGDLAKWLSDGNVEYLGRKDDQVKLRGFRIELGEIETNILASKMVKQSVVIVKDQRLIAYVVENNNFDKTQLMSYLSESLPEYMVPQIWVSIPQIPLNSNGKTDKKALPDPDMESLLSNNYVEPQSDTELKLYQIWKGKLKLDKIGIHDNFFELGGNSLMALGIISGIRKEFDVEVEILELVSNPTISKLSQVVLKLLEKEES